MTSCEACNTTEESHWYGVPNRSGWFCIRCKNKLDTRDSRVNIKRIKGLDNNPTNN